MKGSVLDRFGSVHAAYRRTLAVFKIAHLAVLTDPHARVRTRFAISSEQEIEAEFKAMQHRLADATVINLWVVFERFVIEHVSRVVLARPAPFESFEGRLQAKLGQEIERWRFDEVLDLYKGWVDPDEVGKVKQIKSYRDWIAHQNPKRAPSVRADPDAAYRTLTAIVLTVAESEPGSAEARS